MTSVITVHRRLRRPNRDVDSVSMKKIGIDITHGALLATEEAIKAVSQKEERVQEEHSTVSQKRAAKYVA